MTKFNMQKDNLTEVNKALQSGSDNENFEITNPAGSHNMGVGLKSAINLTIQGPAGYYCGSMNKNANILVQGSGGQGVGSNIMSGSIRIKGNVGSSCGATGHGGLIVVDGDAGSRCGIAMKGVDIVVNGSVGHMSGFMGQAGTMVICGDAGDALADSCYEMTAFVRGSVKSLGTDAEEKQKTPESIAKLEALLKESGFDYKESEFTEYGPARKLYNFKVDNVNAEENKKNK